METSHHKLDSLMQPSPDMHRYAVLLSISIKVYLALFLFVVFAWIDTFLG
jgi:hypothetical protein